jgi:hypothetical protein
MDKTGLLEDLKKRKFVSGIVSTTLRETKPNGDRWYQTNIREVVGNVCTFRNIDFYVVDEGKPGEAAYYKDKEPEQSVMDAATVAADIAAMTAARTLSKELAEKTRDYYDAASKKV